jgi:hypothetical protein
MTPRFDPTRAIVYDLARGQLRDDEGASRLNLPVHLLLRLCRHAGPEGSSEFAQALGAELGRRVTDKLGAGKDAANVEVWTEHLGGQLALVGLGDLKVEQWGRALVLRISGPPADMTKILEGILAGALQRGLSRKATAIGFERGNETEFLIVSDDAAGRVRSLAEGGATLGQIVEELHRGAA